MPQRCIYGRCSKNKAEKVSLFKINRSRFEAWKDIMPGLILNKFICTKHFREEDVIKGWELGGISFQYATPKLKESAKPIYNQLQDKEDSQIETTGGTKRLKRDVIPQDSLAAEQCETRQTQENVNTCQEESNNTKKEELHPEEIQIESDPIEIFEESTCEFDTQESDTLTNIETEPNDLNCNSSNDKDLFLDPIKIELSDSEETEEQDESVLQPLTTVLLRTSKIPENFIDENEDFLET